MNRRAFLSTAALPFLPQAARPQALALVPRFGDGRDWWFRKRFGMFLHWGLYSIHGFQEQEQWRARVPSDAITRAVAAQEVQLCPTIGVLCRGDYPGGSSSAARPRWPARVSPTGSRVHARRSPPVLRRAAAER